MIVHSLDVKQAAETFKANAARTTHEMGVNAEGLGYSVVETQVSGLFYGVSYSVIVARDYYCECRIFHIRRSLFGFYWF